MDPGDFLDVHPTHIQVSPGIQWTYYPAYNANENLLRVGSVLRIRIAI